MKTKTQGVPRAFEPYKQEEVDLILSLVPTHANVKNLAKSLGRSEEAIYIIFHRAYSGMWLKTSLKEMNDDAENIVTKIAKTKKKSGIFIGHEIH